MDNNQTTNGKRYVNGIYIKSKMLSYEGNSNEILNLDLSKMAIENLLANSKNGTTRIVISAKKEITENGLTHVCYFNDFQPTPQAQPTAQATATPTAQAETTPTATPTGKGKKATAKKTAEPVAVTEDSENYPF